MEEQAFALVGGRPSLDFVNTEGEVRNGPPERLLSYESLVEWSAQAGVDEGNGDPTASHVEGKRILGRAITLREALYRIFAAAIAGEEPAPADRDEFNGELALALAHQRLVPGGDGWRWEGAAPSAPDAMLWEIALDAADLLTSDELGRVKECRGDGCSWMFVDRSRNRSRRWCDMADCGNRSKARRYYRRRKDREA